MPKKNKLPKINWRVYVIVVASVLLAVAVALPGKLLFNRDVLMLLGIIVIMALWPTLKNAKIPYIMELKRKGK